MNNIKSYINKEIYVINEYKRRLNDYLENKLIDKDFYEQEYNNMNGRIFELLLILHYIQEGEEE